VATTAKKTTVAAKKDTPVVVPQEAKPQDKQLVKPEPGAITLGDRGLRPNTLDEVWQLAAIIHSSNISPKGCSKEDVFGILATGYEHGLPPMMSLNCIYIVNNRTAVYGDAVPGLVENSKLLEWEKVEEVGAYPNDTYGFKVTSKRIGRDPKSWTFTIADAKKAQLWGKQGPWSTAPKRMLFYRARTFNYRDNFPDVLKGLHTVEEMRDVVMADYVVEDSRTQTDKLADLVTKPSVVDTEDAGQIVDETTGEVLNADTTDMADDTGDLFDKDKESGPDDGMPFGK